MKKGASFSVIKKKNGVLTRGAPNNLETYEINVTLRIIWHNFLLDIWHNGQAAG
jgi:hypothetical protein